MDSITIVLYTLYHRVLLAYKLRCYKFYYACGHSCYHLKIIIHLRHLFHLRVRPPIICSGFSCVNCTYFKFYRIPVGTTNNRFNVFCRYIMLRIIDSLLSIGEWMLSSTPIPSLFTLQMWHYTLRMLY